MRTLCIEPVFASGKHVALSTFQDSNFLLFSLTTKNTENFLKQDCEIVCFDVLKTFPFVSDKFIWDIKILYALKGYRFDNLLNMSSKILGGKATQKYFAYSVQIKAHINSYKQAGVKIHTHSILELIPEELIVNLYKSRLEIVNKLFLKLDEQDKKFYCDFFGSVKFLYGLATKPLNVDIFVLKKFETYYANIIQNNLNSKNEIYLQFNPVGAKTGRLSFKKGSVNLYNLPKEMRSCFVAKKNKTFVEIDFKAFQPRLAIFSTTEEEFKERFKYQQDIYTVFPGDRSQNKLTFLAWMYGKSREVDNKWQQYAWPIWELRNALAKKAREQKYLETKWGRRLYDADEPPHIIFQHFITATEVDSVLSLAKLLEQSGYNVVAPYHDAIILELEDEKLEKLKEVQKISENFLKDIFDARFPVTIRTGKTLGTLRDL